MREITQILTAALLFSALLPGSSAWAGGSGGLAARPSAGHRAHDHPHPAIHPADLPAGAEDGDPLGTFVDDHAGHLADPLGGDSSSDETTSDEDSSEPSRGPSAGPMVGGTAHVPVLLVDFADNPADSDIHRPEHYRDLLFQDGYPYGAGSLRDFYQDQSGGLFDVTGEVSSWMRMPKDYSTYVGSSYGYQGTQPNDQTLVRDAVEAADPAIDFCRSDANGDDYVDTLFVVHAGPGAEEVGSGLWSIKWSLATPYTTQDKCANGRSVKISGFTIEPEEYRDPAYTPDGAPAGLISIGMFVHEFGHVLGLPDLYDTDYSSPGGVGPWDVMASGAWGFNGRSPWRPVSLSAWSKAKLGWVEPQNVTQDSVGVAIPSADAAHSGVFTGVYRLAQDGSAEAREYFLVENREAVGWGAGLPGGGLAVWHVDESRWGSTDNSDDGHRLLTLVQADGYDELGRGTGWASGDLGDLFPGSANKRRLNGSTTPSTDSYSGAETKLAVEAIGDPGRKTVADLFVSGTPQETQPPAPPANLSATAADPGDVDLTWSASSSADVTEYRVYRSTSPDAGFSLVGSVSASTLSYVDTQTVPDTVYYYRVRAFSRLESSDSNTASAATPSEDGTDSSSDRSGTYSPHSVFIRTGSKVSGSASSLSRTDGASLVLRSRKLRPSRFKLAYETITALPSEAAQGNQIQLEVTTPAALTVTPRVYDPGMGSWFALGRTRITRDSPYVFVLSDPGSWMDGSGAIRIRFTSTKRVRFKQALDMVTITTG